MKISQSTLQSILFWLVIFVTAFSLCSVGNIQHANAHEENSHNTVTPCTLNTCSTLISKNVSSPDTTGGTFSSMSLTLIPLLLLFHPFRIPAPTALFSKKERRLENPPQLYQLHAVLII